ncbi:uncharacterized protein LOC126092337 [Schistocerca cancellata]|uniref:uncharacterized protein LOC126092337 n=1 Tax=Schistocerca cancellata TaxID=274614 RepID=UPI002117C7A9|nr:uncharacterized protein LOC126092337 [Schistocerca cancellata]
MESRRGLCELCGGTFKHRKSLYRHIVKFHMDVKRNQGKETCNICHRNFWNVAARDRHFRTHNTSFGKVSCTECNDFKCRFMRDLRSHLECQHGIKIEREEMEFDSMEQFLQWKEKMEGEKRVSFIKQRGGTLNTQKSKIYYLCHRSGNFKTVGLGQRLAGPSVKIGRTCPASLIATKMPSGKVSVQFYATHTGHSFSMGSLHLTPADRAMVADLIASGLSDAEILKKIRDGAHESSLKRVHMLKRKDIYNIKKQYKLDIPLDKNVAVNVKQESSVVNTDNLQAAAQERCDLLKEMMASVDDENISQYIESLDRLIEEASETVASQEEDSIGRQEYIDPKHGHVMAIIYI